MIKIPYEQIVEKIKEEAKLSDSEITEKIDAKMQQLSGLISKEGAAHIVANELGVKLVEVQPQAASGKIQIGNILPGLRNVETVGKVTQKYELRTFQTKDREGKVASLLMGDETGMIRVVMWGDQAENINTIEQGNVVKVVGAYVRENNGYKELHLNEKAKIIINPPGEHVDVKVKVAERKSLSELSEADQSVEVLGTIVQIFDPRFFEVDPKSGKRIQEKDGAYYLGNQIIETPDYSYVLNVVIDDGTSNMRAVFFREQMEKLIGKNKQEVLVYKDNPQSFEQVKTDLLGNLVKIQGRPKKNMFFDRIELMANSVTTNPDPEDEIKRLDAEVEKAKTE